MTEQDLSRGPGTLASYVLNQRDILAPIIVYGGPWIYRVQLLAGVLLGVPSPVILLIYGC
jgi:hypothetical protein